MGMLLYLRVVLPIRLMLGMGDLMIMACTLGTVRPRMRRMI